MQLFLTTRTELQLTTRGGAMEYPTDCANLRPKRRSEERTSAYPTEYSAQLVPLAQHCVHAQLQEQYRSAERLPEPSIAVAILLFKQDGGVDWRERLGARGELERQCVEGEGRATNRVMFFDQCCRTLVRSRMNLPKLLYQYTIIVLLGKISSELQIRNIKL